MNFIGRILGLVTGLGPAIGGASLLVKAGLVAALFITGALAYGSWRAGIVREGRDQAIAEIAKGNAELIERARIGRGKVNTCRGIGKDWNQTTGDCE